MAAVKSRYTYIPKKQSEVKEENLFDNEPLVAQATVRPVPSPKIKPIAAQTTIEIGGENYPVDAVAATVIHRVNTGNKRFIQSVVKWANANYSVAEHSVGEHFDLIKTTRNLSVGDINSAVNVFLLASEKTTTQSVAPAQTTAEPVNEQPAEQSAEKKQDEPTQKNDEPILVFRVGDFYEIVGDDAELGSLALGLTLTTRNGVPMVGFPAHRFTEYSKQLFSYGYNVAIAERPTKEQLQEASLTSLQAELKQTQATTQSAGAMPSIDEFMAAEQTDIDAEDKADAELESVFIENAINRQAQAATQSAPTTTQKQPRSKTDGLFADILAEKSAKPLTPATKAFVDAATPLETDKEKATDKAAFESITEEQYNGEAPMTPDQMASFLRRATNPETSLTDLNAEIESRIARNAAPNYRITDDRLGEYTPKERYENNRDAIKTLKLLESENRFATPEEQATLAKYTGWGALAQQIFNEDRKGKWEQEAYQELKELLTPEEYAAARASTLNAHYTSPTVIKAMWNKIAEMGFERGNVLEPSMGVGNFFGLAPEAIAANASFTGVELDSLTGRIAQKLYPKANIEVTGYEKIPQNGGFYDVAIGNVPFGSYKLYDPQYDKNKFLIHDYFFAKTLDQVRPNGVIAFISSNGTLDKQNNDVRRYIAERASLLGAIRLPNNAFAGNAGTQVTTDIIFLQKREILATISFDREHKKMTVGERVEDDWVNVSSVIKDGEEIRMNPYFFDHPEMVLGKITMDGVMYGGGKDLTCEPIPDANLAEQLSGAMANIKGDIRYTENRDENGNVIVDDNEYLPALSDVRPYTHVVVGNDIYFREESRMRKIQFQESTEKRELRAGIKLSAKGRYDRAKMLQLIELSDALKELYDMQKINASDETIKLAQEKLNRQYDNYVEHFGRLNTGLFDSNEVVPIGLRNRNGKEILSNSDAEAEMLKQAKEYAEKFATYEEKLEPYKEQVVVNNELLGENAESLNDEEIEKLAEKMYQDARKKRRVELKNEGKYKDRELSEVLSKEGMPSKPQERIGVNNPTADLFSDDARWWSLCSLEITDENNNNVFVRKADIFTKRTILGKTNITTAENPVDALIVSINERGGVDLDFMSKLLNQTDKNAIANELVAKGMIFLNPENLKFDDTNPDIPGEPQYEPADEYLSGNVRQKLQIAKEYAVKERAINSDSPKYQTNISALEKVQPREIEAEEISIVFGAPWIPAKYVENFVFEKLQTPAWVRGDNQQRNIMVLYSLIGNGQWEIINKERDKFNEYANSTFGTSRKTAYEIIEATLNMKQITIKDTIDGKEYVNESETNLIKDKQREIKSAFTEWVYNDHNAAMRDDITKIYNEKFNSNRPREYNGSNLVFRGMNSNISLRQHQLDAIARVIFGGNTLLAHEVGAGKTFTMIAGAMESKRIGLCTKSLIAVPKHLIGQTANEFLRLYPDANILVTTKDDFAKENRKKFCARINSVNYDAVIMGHTTFEHIKVSPKRQIEHIENQLAEAREFLEEEKARNIRTGKSKKNFTVKQIERQIRALEAKLKEINAEMNKKNDAVIDFELLGVDKLFVDEAHYFKNLNILSKIQGMNKNGANRANDLYVKCQYLDEITHSKGVVFATGTPVSNSMSELYTMMKYLHSNELDKMDISNFDAWASVFGEMVSDYEVTIANKFKEKTRFAKFNNVPELITITKNFTDIKMAAELNLPVPEHKQHIEEIERSEMQKTIMETIVVRAETISRGAVNPQADNMLKLSGDARRMALDQRLYEPLAPDEPDGKIARVVKNVADVYQQKTFDKNGTEIVNPTQLIFCDLSTPKAKAVGEWNVYNDIKEKLIAKGIPEKEIAFIHDAPTDEQKQALFKNVRTGKIRVLLGSTDKMGAGTNVQDRLVAVHHVDCPWRPSDIMQRNGRIIRPGNQNPTVHIFNYVTKETFDAYQWQILTTKAKFIAQVFNNKNKDRTIEDTDDQTFTFAEIKAIATGNPLILDQMRLNKRVKELDSLRANHIKGQSRSKSLIEKNLPDEIERLSKFLTNCEKDVPLLAAHPLVDNFAPVTIQNVEYRTKGQLKEAGNAIITACQSGQAIRRDLPMGEYRGLKMTLTYSSDLVGRGDGYEMKLAGNHHYTVTLGTSPEGNFTRINNELAKLPEYIEKFKQSIEDNKKQLENLESVRNKPFPYEAELKEVSARLADVNQQLLGESQKEKNSGLVNDAEIISVDETKTTEPSLVSSVDETKTTEPPLVSNEKFLVKNQEQIRRITRAVSKDERYQNAIRNSDRQNAEIECASVLNEVIQNAYVADKEGDYQDIFRKWSDDKSFKTLLSNEIFNNTYQSNSIAPPQSNEKKITWNEYLENVLQMPVKEQVVENAHATRATAEAWTAYAEANKGKLLGDETESQQHDREARMEILKIRREVEADREAGRGDPETIKAQQNFQEIADRNSAQLAEQFGLRPGSITIAKISTYDHLLASKIQHEQPAQSAVSR